MSFAWFSLPGFGQPHLATRRIRKRATLSLAPKVLTLGGFAVGAFFALSGLLVGRSALNRRSGSFAKARFARLMPALWVAILVSAFVVALIGWTHRHHDVEAYFTLRPDGPFAYVGRAATLPVNFSHGIADVFVADTPYGSRSGGSFINGSLWTLPYEIRCYVVIGLVAVVARKFGSRRTMTIAWLVSLALVIGYAKRVDLTSFVAGQYADRQLAAFLFVFLTGAFVAAVGPPESTCSVGCRSLALVLAIVAGRGSAFWSEHVTGGNGVGAAADRGNGRASRRGCCAASTSRTACISTPGRCNNSSALYHWSSRPATFIVISAILAGTCAIASWFLVEKPAMARLRRR